MRIESVWKLVCADRLLGVKIMAEEPSVDGETVRKTLAEDVGTKKVPAKMVPESLSDVQKQAQLDISSDFCC
jgi:hypothetical protein